MPVCFLDKDNDLSRYFQCHLWGGAVVQPQAFDLECYYLGEILLELDGNGHWKQVERGQHFWLDLSQASWQDS